MTNPDVECDIRPGQLWQHISSTDIIIVLGVAYESARAGRLWSCVNVTGTGTCVYVYVRYWFSDPNKWVRIA